MTKSLYLLAATMCLASFTVMAQNVNQNQLPPPPPEAGLSQNDSNRHGGDFPPPPPDVRSTQAGQQPGQFGRGPNGHPPMHGNLSPEERQARQAALRQKLKNMSPEERQQFLSEMRARMQKRYDEAPPEIKEKMKEKMDRLDDRLKRAGDGFTPPPPPPDGTEHPAPPTAQ